MKSRLEEIYHKSTYHSTCYYCTCHILSCFVFIPLFCIIAYLYVCTILDSEWNKNVFFWKKKMDDVQLCKRYQKKNVCAYKFMDFLM